MQEPVDARFPDDETLAVALSHRSRPALEEAYRRYAKPVFGVAYRLTGSATEAEEVLQDVFVGLPELAGSYAGKGSFEGWLGRVAARMALARNRARERRREDSLHRPALGDTTRDWDAADWIALERALAELSATLRETFILKEVEGYSHEEVAEALGIRVGASKVRLYRAKKQLRKLLTS
jgi:RNA polymerase sigma-70 factor (ECF subfamily)